MALCTFEGVVGWVRRRAGNDIGLLLCSGVERCMYLSEHIPLLCFFCFLPQEARDSLASE